MLVGQSTAGKSTIALSFAATITSGGFWPDGQASGEPAHVVFWSGEDGIKETLLPRFLAAGGEGSMMHFISGVRDGERKRLFDPATDMPKLTQAVRGLRDVRLIVLDPIATAVTGDSHRNVETRVGLQPFTDLCAQTGACGLGVHHFTKNTASGTPLDRVSGSLAFHALPRCVLVAARDQNGGRNARRVLMRAKVSNGPRLAAEVIAEAAKAGIAEKTLRNAFRYKLGGGFQRAGYGGPIIWELPQETVQ